MQGTGHSKPAHWDNPKVWDREAGVWGVWDRGTHVHPWLIHVNIWQKPSQCCNQPLIKIIRKIVILLCLWRELRSGFFHPAIMANPLVVAFLNVLFYKAFSLFSWHLVWFVSHYGNSLNASDHLQKSLLHLPLPSLIFSCIISTLL